MDASATATVNCTLEDTEMKCEENRAQWVLNPPQPPCMLRQFLENIKDTMLPSHNSNMFSSLRNQPFPKRVLVLLQNLFPILGSFRNYSTNKLKYDVMAGLTLASVAVPQSMGFTTLARLSPEYGLYTCIVPPFIYAFLTSSREIVIGNVSVDSLMLASMIQKLKDPIHDCAAYTQLVTTATFFVGIFQVAFGLFRFGFLVDYLSHATMVGFLAAAAIIIGLQQLKGLFGIKKFTNKSDIISVMKVVGTSFNNQSEWHPYSLILGFSFLSLILFARFLGKRTRKLFWLSSIAPLLSVIASSLIAYRVNIHQLKVEDYKVEVVGPIKGDGFNPSSLHHLKFDAEYLGPLIKTGLSVAVISLTATIAVGRSFASLRGYKLDTNKEMVSLGLANIAGSFTSCYVATGSVSRTALNYNAGAETMVSSIVMALTILVSLKFVARLLYFTPKAILSAIILSVVPGFIDLQKAYDIWKVDKMDFLACVGVFFGLLFGSAEMGLAIAVAISFAKIILMSIQPGIAVIGRLPGTDVFGDVEQYPMAVNVPGVLIVSVKSAWLCFANASLVRERIEKYVSDEEAEDSKGKSTFNLVILDTSSLINIDTAGIASLEELNKGLTSHGVKLAIANPRWQVIHKLRLANFVSKIGGRVFLSVGEAVDACLGAKMATV